MAEIETETETETETDLASRKDGGADTAQGRRESECPNKQRVTKKRNMEMNRG